jgi:hypothetical protein
MMVPLFIETSKGWINLSAVTLIATHAGEVVFQFERSMVAVPEKEGKAIIDQLEQAFRERLYDFQMGMPNR